MRIPENLHVWIYLCNGEIANGVQFNITEPSFKKLLIGEMNYMKPNKTAPNMII